MEWKNGMFELDWYVLSRDIDNFGDNQGICQSKQTCPAKKMPV